MPAVIQERKSIMKRKDRWYDQHPKLARLLESFKEMPRKQRDSLICGVMAIIKNYDSKLLDKYVMEFPLNLYRRRWYDKDPYLWLMFNGLRYAERSLLKKVAFYLDVTIRKT